MKKGKGNKRMRWHVIAETVGMDTATGVELGVLEGTCSGELLARMGRLELYMVDRWKAYPQDEQDKAPLSRMPQRGQDYFDEMYERAKAVAAKYPERAIIVKGDTARAAEYKRIPDVVDFVFFDARHDKEGLERDIVAWLPKVRKGGALFFHDYGSKNHPDVKSVVDALFSDIKVDADRMAVVRV